MDITVKLIIEKPIAEVWEVMGNQFGHAHLWSSNFKTSQPAGEVRFDGLSYSRRDTTTERGETTQELTAFDPATHSLTYVITKGAPEIAKHAGATWSLEAKGMESTELSMAFQMEPKMPLDEAMEAKISMGLTASVNELAGELKHYLEEGKAQTTAQQNGRS